MPWRLGVEIGAIKERVASLERDMRMVKRLAGRALLLASIWLASAVILIYADKGAEFLAALLKALLT